MCPYEIRLAKAANVIMVPSRIRFLITLCSLLSLWAKNGIRLGGGGGGGGGGTQQTPYGGSKLSFSFSVLSVEFTQFKAFQVEI